MRSSLCIVLAAFGLWACGEQRDPHKAPTEAMGHDMEGRPIVMLNEHQQMMANVTIDTVRRGVIDEMATLLGTTAVDENSRAVISARLKGRVDALYARNLGQPIRTGAPLYSIYSEELMANASEYLTVLRASQDTMLQPGIRARLLQAARRKLELQGLKAAQIKTLEWEGAPSALVTYFSDHSGTLTQLMVYEGQYVEEGTPLFGLADLSEVWVETQLYAGEVAYLRQAGKVEVEFSQLPGAFFPATLAYDNPTLDANTKVNMVRFRLPNPGQQVKPGEMAYIHLSKASRQTVVVPRSAVVYETVPAVWVLTEPGTFEKRHVRLGIQNKKEVEILEGLIPGERIAATGSYLINSEYILQQGAGSMGGMKM
jgi:membrane fusion protein, copper/silver efflux system